MPATKGMPATEGMTATKGIPLPATPGMPAAIPARTGMLSSIGRSAIAGTPAAIKKPAGAIVGL